MLTYLLNTFDSLKRSLWLIPLLMTLLGLLLSFSVFKLDSLFWGSESMFLGEAWSSNANEVQNFFSGACSSIITSLTTVLSITLLIYTVLSGQFGVYVFRAYKLQQFGKFVIGWFSGTYVYLIVYLYNSSSTDQTVNVPQLTISLGLLLSISTIFLLIFYVHSLVRYMQAGTVISQLARELCQKIEKMEPLDKQQPVQKGSNQSEKLTGKPYKIICNQCGYIQGIDKSYLIDLAKKSNSIIEVLFRVGDYVLTGICVVHVHANGKLDKDLFSNIESAFIFGEKRVPVQDLECNLESLVEIASRSLSPGINDIMVANNCIDYISESLALIVTKKFPDPQVFDENGALILISKEFSFEGYINAALNKLRQYSVEHCSSSIRILDNLIMIFSIARNPDYQKHIKTHFHAILTATIETNQNDLDLSFLNERKEKFNRIQPAIVT